MAFIAYMISKNIIRRCENEERTVIPSLRTGIPGPFMLGELSLESVFQVPPPHVFGV